jgi:hypothetical protein
MQAREMLALQRHLMCRFPAGVEETMEKKSKDILKAIDAGQSCEQILAGDSEVTYHDIFHALTEAPTTYWRRTPGRGAGAGLSSEPTATPRRERHRRD